MRGGRETPTRSPTCSLPSALYHDGPFTEPLEGVDAIRDYWAQGVRHSRRDVEFEFEALAVGKRGGIAHWRAEFTSEPAEHRVQLDGILVASIDADVSLHRVPRVVAPPRAVAAGATRRRRANATRQRAYGGIAGAELGVQLRQPGEVVHVGIELADDHGLGLAELAR